MPKVNNRKELRTPEQVLHDRRRRKVKRQIKELRAICLRKINKFCGPPIVVPTNDYFQEVIETVANELILLNWKVTRESEFQGENPRLRIAMR